MNTPNLHIPEQMLVHIIPTRHCIVECPYCSLIKDKIGELPVEEWIDIISKVAPYTIDFNFAGAEPLLYEGINALLRYFNDHDLSYCFSTTGHPILLKGKDIRSYSISIDTLQFENALIPLPIRQKSKWGLDVVEEYKNHLMQNWIGMTVAHWNQDEIIPMLIQFSQTNFRTCLNLVQGSRRQDRTFGYSSNVQEADQNKVDEILCFILDNYDSLKMADQKPFYSALLAGETFFCKDRGRRSITIDTDGKVGVCIDKLHYKVGTVDEFLAGDPATLEKYDAIQKECSGCMYSCYYCYYNDLKWLTMER